jgi:hypothetical protein
MKGRACCVASLFVVFVLFWGVGKSHAVAGCVNQYDEADPNGDCTTSSCTTSCTNLSSGGPAALSKIQPGKSHEAHAVLLRSEPNTVRHLGSDCALPRPAMRTDRFSARPSIHNWFENVYAYEPTNPAEGRS